MWVPGGALCLLIPPLRPSPLALQPQPLLPVFCVMTSSTPCIHGAADLKGRLLLCACLCVCSVCAQCICVRMRHKRGSEKWVASARSRRVISVHTCAGSFPQNATERSRPRPRPRQELGLRSAGQALGAMGCNYDHLMLTFSSHLKIMIFPEGTCTNRTCLITFKPGM